MTRPITDPAVIREMIGRLENWYHQIELAPDIVTPGVHPSRQELARLDSIGLPRDARGLRVLDIGARDGFFSFEMARRGAEVVAADYANPIGTGFRIAAEILGSPLTCQVKNVYNVRPEADGLFDVVLFLGVLYHLRNPLLAIDQLRSVLKPAGQLFVTTHLASEPRVKDMDLPLWQLLPRDSLAGDGTNKWIPNLPGLALALEESSLKVRDALAPPPGTFAYVRAQAAGDESLAFFRMLDSSEGVWGDGSRRRTQIVDENAKPESSG
ncbi:MAG: class I SAM-dependent methyltransferase [Casimicrobiaceae bacterium]